MSDIKNWNVVAASNNAATPDGWPENQAANTVNNCAREMMASLKRWRDDISAVKTTGGTSNAYTLAAAQTITAYAVGDVFIAVANHASTGAATINVDSVAAKSIRKNYNQTIEQGDIVAGQILVLAYDATNDWFQLLSPVCDGAWITPTFAAGNFTGSGSMTWTVESGDVTTFAYTLRGKTMTVAFYIIGTTVGGTVNDTLRIAIPASKTATKTISSPVSIDDNGTPDTGSVRVVAAGASIEISRSDGANFTAATNATSVTGQLTFEVN